MQWQHFLFCYLIILFSILITNEQSMFAQRAQLAPEQTSPPDGTVFHHSSYTTTLEWKPVSDAPSYYAVEIDCYGCHEAGKWSTDVGQVFEILINIKTTSYTFNFVGDQPGRWRVWAVYYDQIDSGFVAGPKSGWWTFSYDTDSDKDGIIDDIDQCDLDKENYNNYQDDDGCPDIDILPYVIAIPAAGVAIPFILNNFPATPPNPTIPANVTPSVRVGNVRVSITK